MRIAIAVNFILVTTTVDMKPQLDIWQLLSFNRKTRCSVAAPILFLHDRRFRWVYNLEACSARTTRKATVRLPVKALHRTHLV